jgi:LPXTG-motif cell wall-anchored protein/uncharacterized repeat protein (TIGR01451 family)
MKKLLTFVAGAVLASAMTLSTVFADTPDQGQIEGGDIYRVKNVTDGTSFVKNVNADPCETVQFKVRIHNPGPRELKNVNVKATLSSGTATSHSSTVTLSASNAYKNETTTATAGVTVSKASKIAYVAGSTELLDNGGSRIATLGDTILTSGVTIDTVGVSLNHIRYVQFKAKLNCPEPEVKKITVCELASKTIVTIKESDFDSSKHSKNLADCAETPTPGEITVCDLETGKVVNISEDDFDAKRHSKDLSDCAETPVVPSELPKTGISTGVLAGFGLSMMAVAGAYALQRRNTLG